MANTDKEMEELFSQRQWDEQGNELAMAPPRAEEAKSEDLFSYDPDKFKATINELGIPQDSQDWYYEEYKKRNSLLSGAYDALDKAQDAGPGRTISNILPMSKPEGKSGIEAIKEGSWDWAVPGAVSGAAEEGIKAVEAPGQMVKGQPFTPEQAQSAAVTTAGMVPAAGAAIAGKGALQYDPNTTRMFLGQTSRDFPKRKAEFDVLEERGVHPKEAWYKSGMTRDPKEGNLMWEVSDQKAKLVDDFDEGVEYMMDRGFATDHEIALGDMLEHSELYEQMPELRNLPVKFASKGTVSANNYDDGVMGWFSPKDGSLTLTPTLLQKGKEEVLDTVLHEIQHNIQKTEGWDWGENPNRVFGKSAAIRERLTPADAEYVKAAEEVQSARNWLNRVRASAETPGGLGDSWDDIFGPVGQEELQHAQKGVAVALTRQNALKRGLSSPERWRELDNFLAVSKDPRLTYQSNTGETMARLTPNRSGLDDYARRANYPFEEKPMYDIEGKRINADLTKTQTRRELDSILFEADPASKSYRDELMGLDEKPKYAEGGMVMDNLEEAMPPAEATSELPPGAIPEDVADDIDAKVSKGEFIVPANVVRFIGVEKLEGMVQKALSKLIDMEKAGRMGGKKPEEPEFATGGLVAPPSGYTPNVGILGGMDQEYQEFQGPNGEVIKVPTKGGQPVTQPPAGYKPISKDGGASAGQDKTGGMLVTRPSQDGTGRDPTKVGLNKDVGDWSVDDFDTYGKSKSTPQGRVGSLAARSIASVMGLGGIVDKAAAHKDKLAQKAMDQMLSTGKDAQGNPLSPEQLESIKSAKSATTAQHAPTAAEKVMGAAVNVARGGLAGKSLVGSVVDEAKAQVSEKLTGSRSPVKGLVGRVTDPIKAGVKDAINTTYGQRKDATQTSEDKDKKEEGSGGGSNRGSDKDSATTSSSTSTASSTSSGTRSSDPGRDN